MHKYIVTVFGSSRPAPDTPLYVQAFELGAAVARQGWTLCNGGYGGTMEAAARGAVSAGGHTIGVTCAAFRKSRANAFIRQEVPTFDLLTRLNTLARLGRAYIVLPGATGTLLELAYVWERLNKGLTRARPLVLLGEFWSPLVRLIEQAEPGVPSLLHCADVSSAIEAIRPCLMPRAARRATHP